VLDGGAIGLEVSGRQRARWQKGLLDTLWANRDMLFRPRYGRIGSFAMPYLWLFELLAPLIETAGLITIVLAASLGVLSREFFIQFLIFGYAFATVISMGAVLQEELTYKRYNDWKDVARLVSYCFLEHFPYRQLHMVWRLRGLWEFFRGDMNWKPLERKGLYSEAGGPLISQLESSRHHKRAGFGGRPILGLTGISATFDNPLRFPSKAGVSGKLWLRPSSLTRTIPQFISETR